MTVDQKLTADLAKAEAAMASTMREHMGSATEQHERLEAIIDALDPRHATGIDRTASAFWKGTAAPR